MPPSDPFNLNRFEKAQNPVIEQVRRELREGRKRTHWMWFVFPQLIGLGRSPMSQLYSLASLAEAQAYMQHPVLGPRLIECVTLVNAVEGRSAYDIFGTPDDRKFHSSMTLFAMAQPGETAFRAALDKYFRGELDPLTHMSD